MKALSVRQPWAWLISQGIKTIETRNWYCDYRGPLAIHASKAINLQLPMWWEKRGIKEPKKYLTGSIIATCDLVEVIRYLSKADFMLDDNKHLCGVDYRICGFVLNNIKPLQSPIPWRGMPGLFEVELCNQE